MAGARVARAGTAVDGTDDRDGRAFVEAQQLRAREVEAARDPRGEGQGRARLAALDLAKHRRADAAAVREVAQAELHRVAQRADARPDRWWVLDRRHGLVRYHVQAY